MVSVAEAERIIQSHLFHPEIEKVALIQANGKTLAEEIKADRDFPPFNRATMDGIAISFEAFENGRREFGIEGVQAAGQPQQLLHDKSCCIEIMTGAPIPVGTDTVIPYENISINNSKAAVMSQGQVLKNQNIHLQGSDSKKDDSLLYKGYKLGASEIALLASVGKSKVSVYKNPKAAVISTGDELVDVDQHPLPHQIRKSNSYALVAALSEVGCTAEMFHLMDDETEVTKNLHEILSKYELIILSGGVSKGKLDFVPKALESLGVKKQFHGVSQRPGKPMWFGVSSKSFVFALPGNPVSTFMCFHRFVKPWLAKSLSQSRKDLTAILAKDFSFAPHLTYFLQVRIENENGKLMAYPEAGGGSGDFANLKDADGFLELPLELNEFNQGSVYPLHSFR